MGRVRGQEPMASTRRRDNGSRAEVGRNARGSRGIGPYLVASNQRDLAQKGTDGVILRKPVAMDELQVPCPIFFLFTTTKLISTQTLSVCGETREHRS